MIGLRCVSCFVGPPATFLASQTTLNLFDNPESIWSAVKLSTSSTIVPFRKTRPSARIPSASTGSWIKISCHLLHTTAKIQTKTISVWSKSIPRSVWWQNAEHIWGYTWLYGPERWYTPRSNRLDDQQPNPSSCTAKSQWLWHYPKPRQVSILKNWDPVLRI